MELRSIRSAAIAIASVLVTSGIAMAAWAETASLIVAPSSVPRGTQFQLHNVGVTRGEARLKIVVTETGAEVLSRQAIVPAHGSVSFALEQLIGSAPVGGPGFYTVTASGDFDGILQQVSLDGGGGLGTNVAGCESGVENLRRFALHANTTAVASHVSTLVIHNVGRAIASARLDLHDALTGDFIGEWVSTEIPVNGSVEIPLAKIEGDIGFVPTRQQRYVNAVLRDGFDGFIQHYVADKSLGSPVEMAGCRFTASNR